MKEEVAKAFVGIAGSLQKRIEEDGPDEVVKWGINAPYRRPKVGRTSAELGTDFHSIAEEIAITGKIPPHDAELAPLVVQYDRWLQKAQPEFLAAEMPVYDTRYGTAGTLDGMMKLQGVPLIHDYKTSKKSFDKKGQPTHPYAEAGLQLAKYRYSEYAVPTPPRRWEQFRRRYYLFGQPELELAQPVPKVDGGIVIHVTPEHCDAYVMRCDEEIHEYFLYLIEAARFQFDVSKTVVGDILQFEERI